MHLDKSEEILYNILIKNFKNVIRQHKSKKYPFKCDFYLPDYDLFIEYQGSWTHGDCIFDIENEEHLKKLQEFHRKAKEINFKGEEKKFYNTAITIWTKTDPLKRQTAKINNLKYLEIFKFENEEDVLNQIKKVI